MVDLNFSFGNEHNMIISTYISLHLLWKYEFHVVKSSGWAEHKHIPSCSTHSISIRHVAIFCSICWSGGKNHHSADVDLPLSFFRCTGSLLVRLDIEEVIVAKLIFWPGGSILAVIDMKPGVSVLSSPFPWLQVRYKGCRGIGRPLWGQTRKSWFKSWQIPRTVY